ncbi:ABC transporter ATP-binding protein [Vermiculatibacterium agrestimuris]|uniref:ABC transporter ATP-binding protein n=1 Tax=Vermiculatibacterium agrestimuris TaxID=2941519 RepID=UPI00203D43FD|nr:ABC transporter ATP-binding protein [Vermiculatibacterium agrestimuris]
MEHKDFQKRGFLSIFASYYKPHLRLFLLDMLCAAVICAVDLAFPYVSRLSMQTLLPQGLYQTFFAVMAILLLAYLLKGVMYFIVTYWGHLMGVNIEADIRRDLFAHMQTLSFSFFDKNRTGQLMSRVTGDLFEIGELAHHGPEDLFISSVTLLGAFCVLLTIRWELALAVFMVVPVFAVFTILQRRRMSRASVAVKGKLAVINGEVESSLSGIRTAQAFANETEENRKFNASNDQFRGAKRGYYKAMATYQSGMELCVGVMSVIVIALGGYFIMQGEMDYTDLITFSLYVTTFITPIRKLSAFVEQFMQGMAGFTRFVELMRTQPDIEDSPDAVELTAVKGDLDLEGVAFSYGEGKPEVLEGIDLHIPAGETLAVVGPSGGGKSTLCQLIPRFYDVTGGSIRLDGRDVREVKLSSLRKNIGIVQQDVFLFAGTIFDNIAYGRPGATEEEVYQAACRAELYDDVMAMPDGFQTYVGERGVMLSGGQKQRVSIARVFLKDPPVLILDEATSALDTVTEQRIQGAFDELARGRTTLIIAHRLSTIRSAHRIAVIDGSRVAELGAWQELIDRGGEFAQLCKAQELT